MKAYISVKKTIILLFTILSIAITFGVIIQIITPEFWSPFTSMQNLLMGIALMLLIGLIIYATYKIIDMTPEKRQKWITISIFLLMTVIFVILMLNFDIRAVTDAYDDIDIAGYLAEHGSVTTDTRYNTIFYYSNNYLFSLILSVFFRVTTMMGIKNYSLYLTIVNVLMMELAIFITYLIVREVYGSSKAGNKTLVFCLLNPLFYGFTFWLYSNTLSLPFMMGGIFLAILIYKQNDIKKEVGLCVAEGLILALGYKIRPTAVFPFMAIIICSIELFLKKDRIRKLVRSYGITLIALILSLFLIGRAENKAFGMVQYKNYPITHWLHMGSTPNGDGSTAGLAHQIAQSDLPKAERSRMCFQETIKNYKQMGITGTLELWLRKMLRVWSDGYEGLHYRMSCGRIESKLYDYICGDRNQMMVIYSHAFRLLTMFGMIVLCVKKKTQGIDTVQSILILTLFIGYCFYMVWEAKFDYAAPFTLVMFILSSAGWSDLIENVDIHEKYVSILPGIIIFLVLSAVTISGSCKYEGVYNQYRLYLSYDESERHLAIIKPGDEEIKQTFYTKKEFNQIQFHLKGSIRDIEKMSAYKVGLYNSEGDLINTAVLNYIDIIGYKLVYNFETIPGGKYCISIRKMNQDKEDMPICYQNSYILDYTEGQFSIGENDNFTGDLIFDAIYVSRGYHCGKAMQMMFFFSYALIFGLCTVFICRNRCRI